MMIRLAEIRERDFMFVDTLNEYYADFDAQIEESYDGWRKFSYEEQDALDELNRPPFLPFAMSSAIIWRMKSMG